MEFADTEYLTFKATPSPSGKTFTVYVRSKRAGDILGLIVWYGAWRQYAFQPNPGCTFNKGCMNDIVGVIDALMAQRRLRLATPTTVMVGVFAVEA